MPADNTNPGGGAMVAAIAGVAVQLIPEIMAMVRARHATADPNAPTPGDAEVLAGLAQAVQSSIATDDAWLAAHPPAPKAPGT
jgi:hypothetical protein